MNTVLNPARGRHRRISRFLPVVRWLGGPQFHWLIVRASWMSTLLVVGFYLGAVSAR